MGTWQRKRCEKKQGKLQINAVKLDFVQKQEKEENENLREESKHINEIQCELRDVKSEKLKLEKDFIKL